MFAEEFSGYAEKAKEYSLPTIVPQIVVGGVSGAGKSSLLNAIVRGRAFEIDPSKPCTRENDATQINVESGRICFIDSPGFSEAEKNAEDYAGRIRELILSKAHLYLLVIGAPNRALDVESQWLRTARSFGLFSTIPGLVVVNKIDLLPPLRDWDPGRINLQNPSSQKERNIVDYLNYVSEVKEIQPFAAQRRVIPVSAGETYDDPIQFNLDALRKSMFDLLPEAARVEFGRQAYLHQQTAEAIVKKYALGVAAEVLINPFGLGTDAAIIIPIQIAMIVQIAKVYGQNVTWTFASSLLGTIATTFVGKAIFGMLVDMVPILKNVAGPPIAYGLTQALGAAAIELFATNQATASREVIQQVAGQYRNLIEQAEKECPSSDVLREKGRLN